MKIPEKGMDRATLFETLNGYRKNDLASKGGRTWAYVYDTARAEIDEVAKDRPTRPFCPKTVWTRRCFRACFGWKTRSSPWRGLT